MFQFVSFILVIVIAAAAKAGELMEFIHVPGPYALPPAGAKWKFWVKSGALESLKGIIALKCSMPVRKNLQKNSKLIGVKRRFSTSFC